MPSLVSAVSNAGGLGRITHSLTYNEASQRSRVVNVSVGILTALTQPNPDALRDAIRETRGKTDKPFGVNISLLPTINPPDYEGFARAAVAEGVRIFETAGNNRS